MDKHNEPTPSPDEPKESQGIDFSTFILSLATSALLQMGEGEQEDKNQVDLTLAKQTVDIIGMLRDKTRGNLTGEESQMLDSVLYDLRLRFLAARKKHGG